MYYACDKNHGEGQFVDWFVVFKRVQICILKDEGA